jgi:hypothetical protein
MDWCRWVGPCTAVDCSVGVHICVEYDAVWAGIILTDVSEEPTAYLGF